MRLFRRREMPIYAIDEWLPEQPEPTREETMTPEQDTETERYGDQADPLDTALSYREQPPAGDPETTDSRLEFPATAPAPRQTCQHCRGTGFELTIRDYLDEIVAMLPTDDADAQDQLIGEFYRRLLTAYPHLIFLFPDDLVHGAALNSKGNNQRDMLWNGLAALLTRYDPDRRDSENMRALDTALAAFGRDHSAFEREDGTVEEATEDEYIAVRNVLLQLCQDALGDKWQAGHTKALVKAYRHAMVKMMNAAEDNPMTAVARRPRQ